MMRRGIWGGLFLLTLLSRPAGADTVTLKSGRELEGIVVDVNDEHLTLHRAAGDGIFQSWRLSRTEIVDVRLSPPELGGFRSVARRLEADRSAGEATDAWRRICILRPEGGSDQIRLIQSFRRAGRLDDAAQAARSAARANPTDPRILLEQGEIALAQGLGSEAVSYARDHLRFAGIVSEEAAWLLGRGLEHTALPVEAMDAYRDVLRAQPRRTDALERFTDLALAQGKPENAVEEGEKMVRAAPDLRAGWITIGKVRYRQGRYADAVTAFQSATRLGGPDYDRARIFLQCSLARRYDRDPRVFLATSDLDIAPQLDPELRRDTP